MCIDLLADAKATNLWEIMTLCNFTKMDLVTIAQFYCSTLTMNIEKPIFITLSFHADI